MLLISGFLFAVSVFRRKPAHPIDIFAYLFRLPSIQRRSSVFYFVVDGLPAISCAIINLAKQNCSAIFSWRYIYSSDVIYRIIEIVSY